MSGNSYKQNMGFEAEVRRTAEAVWNQEPGSCQPAHYSNDPDFGVRVKTSGLMARMLGPKQE